MAELLFEIGCEEMPAGFVVPALKALERLAAQALANQNLPHGRLNTMGTPRRLAFMVQDLAEKQADREQEILGPPVKAAFDPEGNPTKAALGFAKSQGVDVKELEQIDTEKGPRVGFVRKVRGLPTGEVLSAVLPGLVEKIPFAKTMRWGSGNIRFARPIHWFLAVLDGQVVPFELAGLKSGNLTYGHRFLAPEAIEINSASEYEEKLRDASVFVDRDERRSLVDMEVETTGQIAGGKVVPDAELIEEVTDLVEYPVACCGSFDREFLKVPRQVIITAMRKHQRYFALEDDKGDLMPNFIAMNNVKPRDLAVVTQGHERVLRARLADARFFLEEDTKRPLIDRLEDLKQVTYHAKLGTSYDKVERFARLAEFLADKTVPDQKDQVAQAARLCKCDLVTEMVGEFPSLQGVVGKEYALMEGEASEVAAAIAEHYMPLGGEGDLPASKLGLIVGLADRMDTICGLFGIGETPTGAADPYGLRRAAIAAIRIFKQFESPLYLGEVLDFALEGLSAKLARPKDEVKAEVTEFIGNRNQGLLTAAGVPTDVAQAVLAAGFDDLRSTEQRALALAAVKDSPDFATLAVGMKRVMNILRKEAVEVPENPPQEALMTEPAERGLYDSFKALKDEAQSRFAQGDFKGFLQGLSALKGPIDEFFDQVLVMEKDEALRKNRLALLNHIAKLFGQLAEFTHLQLV